MKIRNGNIHDLNSVKELGQNTWKQFENDLTYENWDKLSSIISDENLYKELLLNSKGFVCENETGEIIGMSFLVASGNPTEIYNWRTMLHPFRNSFRKIQRFKYRTETYRRMY
jgi:hypothetical protein